MLTCLRSVLITEDSLGVAEIVANQLRLDGMSVDILSQSDLAERTALPSRVKHLSGGVDAIVHLSPVTLSSMPDSYDAWKQMTQIQVKALFQLLTLLLPKRDDKQDRPFRVIASSLMGGRFGRHIWTDGALPIGGANVGLLKSVSRELPMVAVRAADFDPAQSPLSIAASIISEFYSSEEDVEVGYPAGVRTVFSHTAAPLIKENARSADLTGSADWVVLATGGARGITAEVLKRFLVPGMSLVVTGRTPHPEEIPDDIAQVASTAEIQRLVLDTWPSGSIPQPRELELEVARIQRDREITRNLACFSDVTASVTYVRCDMTNPESVGRLLTGIYRSHGRLDAVIHGAGIINDKLVQDKSWPAFDHVFDTKADSAFLLSRSLDLPRIRLFVFFSSIAGRIGNAGQTDYAAANELLNRFAWYLKHRSPSTRVISMNWGPWAGAGMATAAIRTNLQKRGITAMSTVEGCSAFANEVAFGADDDTEVLLGYSQD